MCAVEEQQEWRSAPGPSSSSSVLVGDLLPSTEYQFSVMPHNKLGSGPFSDITSARTMGQNQLLLPLLTSSRSPFSLSRSICTTCDLFIFFWLPIQMRSLHRPSWNRPRRYPSTRVPRVFIYAGRFHRLGSYLSTVLSSSHVLRTGSGRRWMRTSVRIRVKCLFRDCRRYCLVLLFDL